MKTTRRNGNGTPGSRAVATDAAVWALFPTDGVGDDLTGACHAKSHPRRHLQTFEMAYSVGQAHSTV